MVFVYVVSVEEGGRPLRLKSLDGGSSLPQSRSVVLVEREECPRQNRDHCCVTGHSNELTPDGGGPSVREVPVHGPVVTRGVSRFTPVLSSLHGPRRHFRSRPNAMKVSTVSNVGLTGGHFGGSLPRPIRSIFSQVVLGRNRVKYGSMS